MAGGGRPTPHRPRGVGDRRPPVRRLVPPRRSPGTRADRPRHRPRHPARHTDPLRTPGARQKPYRTPGRHHRPLLPQARRQPPRRPLRDLPGTRTTTGRTAPRLRPRRGPRRTRPALVRRRTQALRGGRRQRGRAGRQPRPAGRDTRLQAAVLHRLADARPAPRRTRTPPGRLARHAAPLPPGVDRRSGPARHVHRSVPQARPHPPVLQLHPLGRPLGPARTRLQPRLPQHRARLRTDRSQGAVCRDSPGAGPPA